MIFDMISVLKLAESDDVGETDLRVINARKKRHFLSYRKRRRELFKHHFVAW